MQQRQITRFGLVYGLVGLMLLIGTSAGCKQKKYVAPILGASSGDVLLGGGGGIAQQIRLWTQISESQAEPGAQATVRIIASVKDSLGKPVPDGNTVVWLATIGALDAATSTTTDGITSVTLTFPPNFTECSRVTAICGEAQATEKACVSVSPSNIAIWANDTDLEWNGSTAITVQLTTDGKPDVGFQVDFTMTLDPSSDFRIVKIDPALTVLTNAQGKATIYLDVENTSGDLAFITVEATEAVAEDVTARSAKLQILVRPEP